MLRKVAMVFISVCLRSLGKIVQALAVIVLLVLYLFLTFRNKPYMTYRLNKLELTSLISSSLSIYSGIFFLSSRNPNDSSFVPNEDRKF